MCCVSTCFGGYKPTQNNPEKHSLRGLQAARQSAGRGRTGCQHPPYPVFDHSHRQHPAQHTPSGVPAVWCSRARGQGRGFLVLNRPTCKEHS